MQPVLEGMVYFVFLSLHPIMAVDKTRLNHFMSYINYRPHQVYIKFCQTKKCINT